MRATRSGFAALALIGLLSAIPGGAFAQKALKDKKGKPVMVGLQLYSVRDDCAKDLPGVLKAIAKMGYTGVEFAGYYGRSAPELKEMLDRNGLKAYGTHIALDTLLGDNFDKTVAFNKVIENKFLCVPWIPEDRRNSRDAIVKTAKLFEEIAAKLKPHGMAFGYHNHTEEFTPVEGETPFDTLFGNCNNTVAIQFDIGNAMHGGAHSEPYLERYPGRTLSVHVKDHSKTNDKALLGEGDVRWDKVIPLLKNKAGTKWFIIEQESYAVPPLECVEKCLRNFEKMWEKFR